MKTKLSLITFAGFFRIVLFSFLALSPAPLALSQIPQGFNYQAVARLTTGDPIINTTLPVRITIQADSLGTSVIWQELHSSVTTNGFGLLILTLGKGARQAASTVATFSAIDWSVTPKFIKTEINYSGWKTMGVTRLWSVPYSTIAGSFGGPVKKLAVKGETALPDDALFEVKNKDGQTVFAVYNEGVRVYVSDGAKALKGGFAVGGFGTDKAESTKYLFVGKDSVRVYLDTNPLTKKLKGGFAVGGYDLTKGVVQDYFDVNSDSVRIYIDSDPSTKKLKGGFAVGGYDMTKGTNTNYMNVNTDATGIINPSQNRVLWYPLLDKNAFLAGRVLIQHPDSIGVNSVTTGYESRAKGQYSQALGYKAIARGDYSTAIGKNALANKVNAFAFGENANAKNEESYAIGRGAIAEGFRSYAFGSAGVDSAGQVTGVAYAKGDYSFAIGQGSQALNKGSFAIGIADTASGEYSTAIGYKTKASSYSTGMGYTTTASGGFSTAMGYKTTASGNFSTAMGSETKASERYSTAMGSETTASGLYSTAMGYATRASGRYSTAIGAVTTAGGWYSTALGVQTYAGGTASTAMGSSTATGSLSTAMGEAKANTYAMVAAGRYNDTTKYHGNNSYYYWYQDDPLFVIGKGTAQFDRSNALTVLKNGNTGIGTSTPQTVLHIKGNAPIINLEGSDHCYMQWYPDGIAAGRKGYFGFPGAAVNDIILSNEISSGDIALLPGSTGSVGINISNPEAKLEISDWNGDRLAFYAKADNTLCVQTLLDNQPLTAYAYGGNLENKLILQPLIGNVGIGTLTPGYKLQVGNLGDGTQARSNGWNLLSDARYKKDLVKLDGALRKINSLTGYYFFWNTGIDNRRQLGLLAQDVEKVLPEVVSEGTDGILSMDYGKIVPLLVEAIKDQQQQIDELRELVDKLISEKE